MHPKPERREPDSLRGHTVPPSAVGYVVAGALLALNLVYCTHVFVFHTLYDSNFTECPLTPWDPSGNVGELVLAQSLQTWLRNPTHSIDTLQAMEPPQEQLAGEGPQEVGSKACLVCLSHSCPAGHLLINSFQCA